MKMLVPLLAAILLTRAARAADPPVPDIDEQYQNVLSVMKHPAVTGVLVTEIMPDSVGGASGLQAGDTITHYYGTRIADLATLRQRLAEAIARRVMDDAHPAAPSAIVGSGSSGNVLLTARRGPKDITLQVPRQPLGIRAIEVEAGVAAPLNPPASPRGSVTIAWDAVLKKQEPLFFRLTQPSDERELWLGWQKSTLTADGTSGLTGTCTLSLFDLPPTDDPVTPGKPSHRDQFTFHLRLGDYTSTPAFLLDSAQVTLVPDPDHRSATLHRTGDALRSTPQDPASPPRPALVSRDFPCPLNAIPEQALPYLAAAISQQDQAALSLYLLSLKDLISRPGYVLVSRGKQPLTPLSEQPVTTSAPTTSITPPPSAWRVDLLHCGVRVESYWIADDRQLLLTQAAGPTPILSRRVASEAQVLPATEDKSATTQAQPN